MLGDLTCDAINIEACRTYVKAITGGAHGRAGGGGYRSEELETLAAVLNLLYRHERRFCSLFFSGRASLGDVGQDQAFGFSSRRLNFRGPKLQFLAS